MELPYILLSQPNIDPSVLQDIIDIAWDALNDVEKQTIYTSLTINNIRFEK